MKFYEICFSPTGGTKKAADILSNELSSEIHPIDLTDSKQDFSDISLSDDDTAVIAVPSYGGRVPEPAVSRLASIKETVQRLSLSVYTATVPMKTHLQNWRIQPKPQDSGLRLL